MLDIANNMRRTTHPQRSPIPITFSKIRIQTKTIAGETQTHKSQETTKQRTPTLLTKMTRNDAIKMTTCE